jgi:hypothetical protein
MVENPFSDDGNPYRSPQCEIVQAQLADRPDVSSDNYSMILATVFFVLSGLAIVGVLIGASYG